MITLRGSGLRKVEDGVTTMEEGARETVHWWGRFVLAHRDTECDVV